MAAKVSAKPKLNTVKATPPPAAKFDLGTRPVSLRGKPPGMAPKAPNTRDYGKTVSNSQPAPPAAIQPGAPMPPMGGAPMARGGKVGW